MRARRAVRPPRRTTDDPSARARSTTSSRRSSGARIAKFSGWGRKTAPAAGIAAITPAPIADVRAGTGVAGDHPGQRRGDRTDDDRTGAPRPSAVGPRSQMNGTCRNDDSGSQWAFDAIGRTAGGRDPRRARRRSRRSRARGARSRPAIGPRRRSSTNRGRRGPCTSLRERSGPRRRARRGALGSARPVQRSTGSWPGRPVRMTYPGCPLEGFGAVPRWVGWPACPGPSATPRAAGSARP